jgi:uncharacterized phage-associated protein
MGVEFRLDVQKAVEVVAMFLKLNDRKPIDHVSLMKLLYMADRLSLERFDTPVIGDRYVSMDKGLVLSNVYDLIKGKVLQDIPEALDVWNKYISRNSKWEIGILEDPSNDELCENDEDVIREIYYKNINKDVSELIDIAHGFPEWQDPHGSSIYLTVEELLNKAGKTEGQIKLIQSDIQRKNYLDRILSHA